jgi:hypothetical protein
VGTRSMASKPGCRLDENPKRQPREDAPNAVPLVALGDHWGGFDPQGKWTSSYAALEAGEYVGRSPQPALRQIKWQSFSESVVTRYFRLPACMPTPSKRPYGSAKPVKTNRPVQFHDQHVIQINARASDIAKRPQNLPKKFDNVHGSIVR